MKTRPTLTAAIAFATLFATTGMAQTAYPARPVTLVVPFPPGGGTDTGARIIAQRLSTKWGQQVIVENKGGAAGQIGADLRSEERRVGKEC